MRKFTSFIAITFLFGITDAQTPSFAPKSEGRNYEQHDEISDALRVEINANIDANIEMLKSQGNLFFNEESADDSGVSFSWPVKMADGVPYNDIWGISNYVDQQPGSGIKDYNCGDKTYNGHSGTDIFLWPFYWYAMDHFQAEVVAGADGQIIYKHDGEDDRSCVMGGGQWNAIYVQHADGSIAWYGHMKKNSLTSKGVGDMVSEGEFLGNVGSSGNSTGPHLHFELYDSGGALVDPFQGDCNNLNSDSKWLNQLPYRKQRINAVATHSAVPVFPDCPMAEIPFFKDFFNPGESIYLFVYLIDQNSGEAFNLKVIRPDGSYLYNWDNIPDNQWVSSWWYWIINDAVEVGEWVWEASYGGETVSHNFFVGNMGVDENRIADVKIYPNPATDLIQVSSGKIIDKLTVTDLNGRQMISEGFSEKNTALDISKLPAGVYVLQIKMGMAVRNHKFIKK